ncbi:hypothetical protein AK812_SmicGene216 [Symbiodinium microadriaticum]|uniref:CBM20 domain-containing protein n=1 Tax=Symbiodinium microadriaticum TaxID=2951 RepID=A0A1Q9F7C5_SYMMI|nr:hypothetical protein AK812_SmicGene216 [Symbiodinium microadriaticum]
MASSDVVQAKLGTRIGEIIRVVGEAEELGKWNPEKSVQLYTDAPWFLQGYCEGYWRKAIAGGQKSRAELTPWFLVGNGGMGYWDYYRGLSGLLPVQSESPGSCNIGTMAAALRSRSASLLEEPLAEAPQEEAGEEEAKASVLQREASRWICQASLLVIVTFYRHIRLLAA